VFVVKELYNYLYDKLLGHRLVVILARSMKYAG
jgi:hypothetical protein